MINQADLVTVSDAELSSLDKKLATKESELSETMKAVAKAEGHFKGLSSLPKTLEVQSYLTYSLKV